MTAPVSLSRCATYEPSAVTAALEEALAPLGGMAAFVSPGQRVLLKPNLLSKADPTRAVTTHPEVLRAVIRAVKACSPGALLVGDSPGGRNSPGGVRKLWDECGISAVCAEEGAELVLLDDDVTTVANPHSQLYSSFMLGAAAVEADVLINLPKLKTHGFMLYTGAVKNMFGCIPGLAKAQFHVKVPERADFAEMLVDLALACAPELTIMDGVIGMEGDGPAGGKPIEIGAVLASADPFALDVVASSIAGFAPGEVYSVDIAHRRGLAPLSPDDVEVRGVPWVEFTPDRFERPHTSMTLKVPGWVANALKGAIIARPELGDAANCTGCATCRENCPVEAIEMRDRKPRFDYEKCIRCYCCQELCPPQVLRLHSPWLLRFFSKRERAEA